VLLTIHPEANDIQPAVPIDNCQFDSSMQKVRPYL